MESRYELNKELAQMLKGGVIMDVTTPEQAKIAEAAGACAVMALERIPADIRAAGGVSRMSDPKMIQGIQNAVTIPVMAKCRIGHFVEAQVLEAIEIDYIDESEVLSPADDVYHINKKNFKVPFVCGAKDLGEALRRINEGASMIRTKGEPGTGDIVQAVRHMRKMNSAIAQIKGMREDELFEIAKQLQVPFDLVSHVYMSRDQEGQNMLDNSRFYYHLIPQLIEEGQKTGEFSKEDSAENLADNYASLERGMIYDWCLKGGSYSLREKGKQLLPIYLQSLRKAG